MQRVLYAALFLAAVLLVAGWVTTPPRLAPPLERQDAGADPAALIGERERAVARERGILAGAEKRIVWAGEAGVQTTYAIVYLHGFSATRQEIAPVPEQVAAALGANLFETRLTGHGVEREPLADVRAEDWLADGSEALAVGRALGERIILMGTSTGATLALAMARHPDFSAVEALVLLSPNFGPSARGSMLMTGPFGTLLPRLMLGEYREWEAANERQGRYWSTRYPTASLVEMMRLVDLAVALAPEARVPRALLIYSPEDQVVAVDRLLQGFAGLPAGVKATHAVRDAGGPSRHVLAGDILAPENNAPSVALITQFLGQ